MNDVFCFELVASGDFRFTCMASAERAALSKKFASCRTVNCSVYTASAEQRFIGGIDDCVAVEFGNIA